MGLSDERIRQLYAAGALPMPLGYVGRQRRPVWLVDDVQTRRSPGQRA